MGVCCQTEDSASPCTICNQGGAGFFFNTCAKIPFNLFNLAFAKCIGSKAYRVNSALLYKLCVLIYLQKKIIACFMNQPKLSLLLIHSFEHPYFHVNSVYNCVQGAFYSNKWFLLHVWLVAVLCGLLGMDFLAPSTCPPM